MHQAAQKQHEPPSDDGSAPRPRDDNGTTAPRQPQQQQQPTTAPTPQQPSSGRQFSRRLARTFHGALADDSDGAVFVVPKAALVHIPLSMSTPLTFCIAYAADPEGRGGGGCPAGADCPHAHADLSAAQRHVPHVRAAEWAATGDVPYAMYGADDARAVRVKVTNSAAGAEVVSVRECLRTAVLEPGSELAQAAAVEAEEGDAAAAAAAACVTRAGARITTLYHCAHWLVKRKCNYGRDCRFVHVALPSAQTLQRAMNPSGAPQKNAERQEDDADPLSPAASSPRSRGDDDRRGLAAAAIEDERSSQRDDDDDDLDSVNSSHSTDGLFTLPATAVTKPSDGRDDHEASPPTADLLTTQPPSMVCVPELRAEDTLVDVGLPLQVSRRQYSPQHHQPSHHDQHPQQQQQHPSTVPGAAVGEQSVSDRHDDVDAAGLSGKFARFSSLPLQQQHAAHHGSSPQLRASLHRHSDASMRTADASYLTDPRRASFAASYAHNSSNSAMLHMSSMAQSSAAWDPRRGSASLSISHATLVDPSSATTAHRAAIAAAAGGDVAAHPDPAGDGNKQQRSAWPPAHQQQQRRYGDGDLALAAASLESMPGSVLGSSSQRVQLGSSAEHPLLRGDVAVTPPATHHHPHCYQQQHVDAAALRADGHVMPPRPQRSSAPRRFPFRHQPYAARPLPSLAVD